MQPGEVLLFCNHKVIFSGDIRAGLNFSHHLTEIDLAKVLGQGEGSSSVKQKSQ